MLGPQLAGALLLNAVLLVTLRAAPATVKVQLPAETQTAGSRLVLHFENLKLPPNSSGLVRVFADLPKADANTSTEDEHFLGYFAVMPKNSAETARGIQRNTATLDLSPKKHKLAGKKEVTLTIVPLGGPSLLPQPDASQSKPTFARVYVSHD